MVIVSSHRFAVDARRRFLSILCLNLLRLLLALAPGAKPLLIARRLPPTRPAEIHDKRCDYHHCHHHYLRHDNTRLRSSFERKDGGGGDDGQSH